MDADKDRRLQNLHTVRTYFRLLQERDIDRWIMLWASDGTQVTPLVRNGFPKVVSGRSRIESSYRARFADYVGIDFVGLRIEPLDALGRVLARWHMHAKLSAGGSHDKDHVALFEFDETGAISMLTLIDLFD